MDISEKENMWLLSDEKRTNSTAISVLLSEYVERSAIGPTVGSLFGFVAKARKWVSFWESAFL